MAGNLFVFPRPIAFDVGVVQPGAKLTFTLTGTTTPQNTYTDVDLTTPHANPVVADAEGLFSPIYMDPSFDDYRVKYTDSADVLIYQDDDIPASQSGQSLTLTAAVPFIDLIENDASANNGVWRIAVNSEQMTIKVGNDALSAFTDIVTIDRTANTVDTVDFLPTTLNHNGTAVAVGITTETGSFNVDLIGFVSNPATVAYVYTRVGNIVTILPGASRSGTSNSTVMRSGATDVPASLRPSSDRMCLGSIQDNGTTAVGLLQIKTTGEIEYFADPGAGVFTTSGTKGIHELVCSTYKL